MITRMVSAIVVWALGIFVLGFLTQMVVWRVDGGVHLGGISTTKKAASAFGSLAGTGYASMNSNRESQAMYAPNTADTSVGSDMPIKVSGYAFALQDGLIADPGADTLTVYKRISDANLFSSLGFTSKLFDIGSFTKPAIQNISWQDADGYTISIDATYGSLYISDSKVGLARAEATSAIPLTDEEAIGIANSFLSKHRISRASYDSPTITKNTDYGSPLALDTSASEGKLIAPVVTSFTQVLYPLKLNGKSVYDSSGNISGITVLIDGSSKRVNTVNGVINRSFELSDYPVERDTTLLKQLAEDGGMWDGVSAVSGAEVYNLEKPELAYVLTGKSSDDGTYAEYFIPAYVFPIANRPTTIWQQRVVVPLVKDFLSDTNTGGGSVPPASGVEPDTATAVPQ